MEVKTKEIRIQFDPKTGREPELIIGFSANLTPTGVLMVDSLDGDVLKTVMYPSGFWVACEMENKLNPEWVSKIIASADGVDGDKIKKAYQNQ